MKTTLASACFLRACLLSTLLLGAAACGKKDSDDANPNDPTATAAVNEVHWQLNGTEYVGRDIAQAQAHYRPTTQNNLPATAKDMLIIAHDDKNYQISVLMTNFTGVGTYSLTPTNGMIGSFTPMDGSKLTYSSLWSVKAPAGQFVVTEFDAAKSILKGTFTFNARIQYSGGTYSPDQTLTGGTFDFKKLVVY